MQKESTIYIAGHRGLVCSAVMQNLQDRGYSKIVTRSSADLDLRRQVDVEAFFRQNTPEYVVLAAARVGGIGANSAAKANFFYDNMMIAANVIHSAYKFKVKKLLNLGSSCIYPRLAPQPLKEDYLLTGPLEETNDAYAIAKIKMCKYYNDQYHTNFISVMPTNLYGRNDNFNLETSHVLPALIRKIYHANKINGSSVELWGNGTPRREFLFADDLAEAVVFLMEKYDYNEIGEFVNIGTGNDISIKELAELIAEVIGYAGGFTWDTSKPNGTPRKLLDVSRIHFLGWKAAIDLKTGIRMTVDWFRKQNA